jgi:hypothetical protein
MCKGLGRDLVLLLFGCPTWIFDRRLSDIFLAEVFQNSSSNFLAAHNHQNRCCVLVWGSFIGFHCSEVLELHRALTLSSAARAYENAES